MFCPISLGKSGVACWLWLASVSFAAAGEPTDLPALTPLGWQHDYGEAWRQADMRDKMLLIWFQNRNHSRLHTEVDKAFSEDPTVRTRLDDYVLLRLPADAEIFSSGKPLRLLGHPAFAEMHGYEGLAIIDLADEDRATYRCVVSAFPFMQGKFYRFDVRQLPVILDLPPGTITERTMIWAVRTHPERPQSTEGTKHATLNLEARQHSGNQAQMGVQGHHRWDGRFQRIRQLLGGLFAPVEVVAESWPGQTMIDSCVDCVASWRQSPGHWQAVRGRHAYYGYDIKRGRNGIWYGTGILSGLWR